MTTQMNLEDKLKNLDFKSYGAYKSLKGGYNFGWYYLIIDHIQADPFASPSKMHILINRKTAKIPTDLLNSNLKRIAVSDFLTRAFRYQIEKIGHKNFGSGHSGQISISHCGQEMLKRTSVQIYNESIEVRFQLGMPAAGRRILARKAINIFKHILPQVVTHSLLFKNLDQKGLRKQVQLILDQHTIRLEMKKRNLVAFVANGSILPRESGVSDKPLTDAVPFKSPKSMETKIRLQNEKEITGMAIPKGITLIVGGGYHGKSTLLRALELGVYNHIPNDGRELVLTNKSAMKIKAEDGRSVSNVNITPFINNIPGKKNTTNFSSANASGSTSQAANVIEALEAKTSLLLIDEDTSATNFMIRDGRMQKLVAKEKEPITPFVDKVKPLFEDQGVSTILVTGGSGDYFDIANMVIMMDEYKPFDVTDRAHKIAKTNGYERDILSDKEFGTVNERIPLVSSFNQKGKHDRFKIKGKFTILYGHERDDLSGLEQLVDNDQTNCIGIIFSYMEKKMINNKTSLIKLVDQIYKQIQIKGLDSLQPKFSHNGSLALPRKQEIIGALNRFRKLKIKQKVLSKAR